MRSMNFKSLITAIQYFFNPLETYKCRIKKMFKSNSPSQIMEKDFEALQTDWKTIGQDFRKAINDYSRH